MFGGVGIYARDLFFALIDDDTLFFKVDETTRVQYDALGMKPFAYGDPPQVSIGYSEVPGDILEDVGALAPWVEDAIAVARRKRTAKRPAPRAARGTGNQAKRTGAKPRVRKPRGAAAKKRKSSKKRSTR